MRAVAVRRWSERRPGALHGPPADLRRPPVSSCTSWRREATITVYIESRIFLWTTVENDARSARPERVLACML